MKKLIILIGISGSGKSTYAKRLSEKIEGAKIFSSDEKRRSLFNSLSQEDNNLVFKSLYEDMRAWLSEGKTAILDATNLSCRRRVHLISTLPKDTEVEAHVIATPYEKCLSNNKDRGEAFVPEQVIKNQLLRFNFPVYGEGIKTIEVIKEQEILDIWDLYKEMEGFPQENPYHQLTLKEHCDKACELSLTELSWAMSTKYRNVFPVALMLHDYGKLHTKTYEINDGVKVAHYYGHENVSAYYLACAGAPLLSIQLVQYHMRRVKDLSEKAKKRLLSIIGSELFEMVRAFNHLDELAKS